MYILLSIVELKINLRIRLILNDFSSGFVRFVFVAIHFTSEWLSSLCRDTISKILVVLGIRCWFLLNNWYVENFAELTPSIIFISRLELLYHFNFGFGSPMSIIIRQSNMIHCILLHWMMMGRRKRFRIYIYI